MILADLFNTCLKLFSSEHNILRKVQTQIQCQQSNLRMTVTGLQRAVMSVLVSFLSSR